MSAGGGSGAGSAAQHRCGSCRLEISPGDRFCRHCGAIVSSGATADVLSRKNAAILFADLVGWTTLAERLDPELVRGLLDSHYRLCAANVADQGGTVEKYIGDALMAVWGIPVSHEDDPVRALRAAAAVVAGVPGLQAADLGPGVRLAAHCGVTFGEVLTSATPEGRLQIVGDPVNTASRLQSAAMANEILVSEPVAQLVRRHAQLEERPPVQLKGKSGTARVFMVMSMRQAELNRARVPLVDRARETARLERLYHQARESRRLHGVLVRGPAGIGKTRVVEEFVSAARSQSAAVLTGSCQANGMDITYQPLAQMLREALPGGRVNGLSLMEGHPDRERVASLLATVLEPGGNGARAGGRTEEVAWAVAHAFRRLAERRPLVVVWENLHLAGPDLLRLIKLVAQRLHDSPVVMVSVARELPPGEVPGTVINVAQLSGEYIARLVGALATAVGLRQRLGQSTDQTVERIAGSCEGNPLFASMMVEAAASESWQDRLPASVTAVIQARIDALPAAERRVLSWAAVCGREFTWDQIRALAELEGRGRQADAGSCLSALRQRGLIRDTAKDNYRFAEDLVRETAYSMIAKAVRAAWHARLAEQALPPPAPGLQTPAAARDDLYHAEAASRLYREVSPHHPSVGPVTRRAVALLVTEAGAASASRNLSASISLLERARELLDGQQAEYADVIVRLTDAMLARGDGEAVLTALARAQAYCATDAGLVAIALQQAIVETRFGILGIAEAQRQADRDSARLAADDSLGRCLLHQLRALIAIRQGNYGAAEKQERLALTHARHLGDEYAEHRIMGALCEVIQWSPLPVADGLAVCAAAAAAFGTDRILLVPVLSAQARLLALAGATAEARSVLAAARQHAGELRADLAALLVAQAEGVVLSLTGETDAAASVFLDTADGLAALGHATAAQTLYLYAAREALLDGNAEAAAMPLEQASRLTDDPEPDPRARLWLRLLSAHLAALRGQAAHAVVDAAGALAAQVTDDPCLLGDASFHYALIAQAAGRPDEAAASAARALGWYAGKGATLPMRRIQSWAAAAGIPLADRAG